MKVVVFLAAILFGYLAQAQTYPFEKFYGKYSITSCQKKGIALKDDFCAYKSVSIETGAGNLISSRYVLTDGKFGTAGSLSAGWLMQKEMEDRGFTYKFEELDGKARYYMRTSKYGDGHREFIEAEMHKDKEGLVHFTQKEGREQEDGSKNEGEVTMVLTPKK